MSSPRTGILFLIGFRGLGLDNIMEMEIEGLKKIKKNSMEIFIFAMPPIYL